MEVVELFFYGSDWCRDRYASTAAPIVGKKNSSPIYRITMNPSGKVLKSSGNVVPFKQPVPADALHAGRERLVEDQARLAKVEASCELARQSLVEAKAAVERLDADERSAWERYAETTDAPEPKPDEDRRRELNRKLALAEADARGAKNAALGVAPRLREIVSRLKRSAFRRKRSLHF